MSKPKNQIYNDDGNIFGSNDDNKTKKQNTKSSQPPKYRFLAIFLPLFLAIFCSILFSQEYYRLNSECSSVGGTACLDGTSSGLVLALFAILFPLFIFLEIRISYANRSKRS